MRPTILPTLLMALLCLGAAGLLAGCADAPQSAPAEAGLPAGGAASPESVEGIHPPAAGSGVAYGWAREGEGVLRVTASGPAGSFFVLHMPFVEPSGKFDVAMDVEATVAAGPDGPVGVFVWLPTFTVGSPQAWTVWGPNAFQGETLKAVAAPYQTEVMRTYGFESDPPAAGVLVAMAAEAAWTYTAQVEVPFAFGAAPWVATGSGAVFATGPAGVLGVPTADQMSWQTPVPGEGWTHLQIASRIVEPVGLRDVELALGNGEGYANTGFETGVMHPFGGQTQGGNWVDFVGSLADTAGTASAEMTYAGGRIDVGFRLVHLPLSAAALDPTMDGPGYQGSDWPYDEAWPPLG